MPHAAIQLVYSASCRRGDAAQLRVSSGLGGATYRGACVLDDSQEASGKRERSWSGYSQEAGTMK